MEKNIIYKVLSWTWRNTVLRCYRGCRERRKENYWKEHAKRFGGENKDKTFYVIRRRDCYCGLFSLFLTNLQRIDNALKAGYIPVVDLQNDFNIYLPEDKIGRENAWEYYFKQPMGYTLDDIRNSRHVVIGSGAVPPMFPYLNIDFLYGRTGELTYWRELAEKYMVLSDEASQRVEEAYKKLFVSGEKVLGVICRGTDYSSGKPKNHPIQPTVEQILGKAKSIFAERACDKIFLATEDKIYYSAFREAFGDKLIVNTVEFIDYKKGAIGKLLYEDKNDNYENGMVYLTSILLVSRCDCLCAGCVSGTVGALLLTKGYEYTYLFDLGIYE